MGISDTQEIRQVFVTHRGRYGSPRIQRELKDQGQRIACKRVARLMREAELYAKRKRRRGFKSENRDVRFLSTLHVLKG